MMGEGKHQRAGVGSHGGVTPAEGLLPEAHEASQPARADEEQFRLVFDRAPIGMALVGLDYRLYRVNEALCEVLGYSRRELLKRTFVDITHPDDVGKDVVLAGRLFRGEIPSYRLEKRFTTKDGRLVWLDLTALVIRNWQGAPLYGLAMVEDITDRKHIEAALRTSEERYRSFVVNSSEAIVRHELERPIDITLPADEQIELFKKYAYVAECNDVMARLYGHDRADDFVGARLGQYFTVADEGNIASLRTFVANGYRLLDVETVEVLADGRRRHFTSSLIGIVVNGYLLRVWGTRRDETERKTAEEQVESSRQQLRALAAHLQSVREKERADIAREIHDVLGQGLTGLKMDVARLTRMLPESADAGVRDSMAERLKGVGLLLDETIAAVKNLSTELRPRVLDALGLSAAVEWQCQEFERRTRIPCECALPDEGVRFGAEQATALFRILQEALTNVARHARARHVSVGLHVGDDRATLCVQDDGGGVTDEQLSAPSSLGLLGMRERAEMLGGTLAVKGRMDEGTLVTASILLSGPSD
ncbi:MAG: PAS domain S-box protein [Pyrinomonadaceae bacterium]